MSRRTANTLSQIIVVELTDGTKQLIVRMQYACGCGQEDLVIAGHHLKSLRDAVVDAIDRYPELAGPEPTVVEQTTFRSRGNDPSTS